MSVGDIIFSLSLAHFNSIAPSDDDYYVWNARGNQATCSAQGFVAYLGSTVSVFYTCSLVLYSMAAVKYNKRDSYIHAKIEPFLHGVPIVWGFIASTILLVGKNLNHRGNGLCTLVVYDPPHCIGYADGDVHEGFEVPCGRGHDGAVLFYYFAFFFTFFAVPIIIGVSLWMIYRAVKQQEQAIARYGAGAFAANTNTHQTSSGANSDEDEGANHHTFLDRLGRIIRSAVSSLKRGRSTEQSSSVSNSRVVLRRAFAFTILYFLTWTGYFIVVCFDIGGKDAPDAILYLSAIFNPLQGFFNLCIFLQPSVLKIKSRAGNDKTWCQAVTQAIWHNGRGDRAPGRGEGRGGGHANRAQEPQPDAEEREGEEPKRSHTQRMSLEAQEDVQESPGADGPHDSNVPSDGAVAQIDTVEPQWRIKETYAEDQNGHE